jgi:hypothetical protein
MPASPLPIHGKSRMRKRARTDLCGGRPVMVVPTATVIETRLHGLVTGSLSAVSEVPVQSTSANTFPLVGASDTALRLVVPDPSDIRSGTHLRLDRSYFA